MWQTFFPKLFIFQQIQFRPTARLIDRVMHAIELKIIFLGFLRSQTLTTQIVLCQSFSGYSFNSTFQESDLISRLVLATWKPLNNHYAHVIDRISTDQLICLNKRKPPGSLLETSLFFLSPHTVLTVKDRGDMQLVCTEYILKDPNHQPTIR